MLKHYSVIDIVGPKKMYSAMGPAPGNYKYVASNDDVIKYGGGGGFSYNCVTIPAAQCNGLSGHHALEVGRSVPVKTFS